MKAKEVLQFALTVSDRVVLGEIDKMTDAPMTFPTPNGGCHPLWVLGHLTLVEGMIPAALYGEENAAADWQKYFGEGSETVASPSAYPPFAEVRKRYLELRERNSKILESLTDADLDKPTVAPPKGREREFATFGSSFLVLALHQAMHRGNVTDSRRAASAVAARAA